MPSMADDTESNPPPSEGELPRLRTMKHDAARYLKDKNVSFLEMVAEERKRADRGPFQFRERLSEKAWFRGVLVLVALVFISLLAYTGFIFFIKQSPSSSNGAQVASALIATDEREIITVRETDRAGLLIKLEAARRDRLPSNLIKHVVVRLERFGGEDSFATPRSFFATLDFKPPQGLAANLTDTLNVLLYYKQGGADIGIILEATDYERALASMRAWERTMVLDFRNLYFDEEVAPTSRPFEDKTVQNIDIRVLNISNTAQLSYAFFARKYLLIAASDEFMRLMINRLLASPPSS